MEHIKRNCSSKALVQPLGGLRGWAEAKMQLFQIWSYCIHGSKYFAHTTPTLGWDLKVKIRLFQNMVMLPITLKGITNAAKSKHILCPYTHTLNPWGVASKVKQFLF